MSRNTPENSYILLFISIEGKESGTEKHFFSNLAENYDQILFSQINNIGKDDKELSDVAKLSLEMTLKDIKRNSSIEKVKLIVSCDGDVFTSLKGTKKSFENTYTKLKEHVELMIKPKKLESSFKYDYGGNIETFLWICSEYFNEQLFLNNYNNLTNIKHIIDKDIYKMYGNVRHIKTNSKRNSLWKYLCNYYGCENPQQVVKKINEKFKDKKVPHSDNPYSVYFDFIKEIIDIYEWTDNKHYVKRKPN